MSAHSELVAKVTAGDPAESDGFVGRMSRLRIETKSPDWTVTARYTVTSGYEIGIDPNRYRKHNDNSLAEQIKAAVDGVNRGYSKGTSVLFPDGEQSRRRRAANPVAKRRAEEMSQCIAEIDIVEQSLHGHVKVRMRGAGSTEVKVRPGSRAIVDAESLADEASEALNAANREFGRRRMRIHETVYRLA